jgi:osmotically-inducible protein OsmY
MGAIIDNDSGHLPYPYGETSRDEEVLAWVLNALHHQTGVPLEQVRVQVSGGRCTLSGVVAHDYQRGLAADAVASTDGVVEVLNNISLTS